MTALLTLIAGDAETPLDRPLIDAIRAAADRLGGEAGPPDWLAPEIACDLTIDGLDADQVAAAAALEIGDAPLDAVTQAIDGAVPRRKSLLLADMESTIIAEEMLDVMAETLRLGPGIAEITRRAMNGELDFAEALAERVALLEGVEAALLDRLAAGMTPNPGAAVLVATMRQAGARCVLVSGGFTVFTGRIRERLGFDADFGNVLEMADGRLTGQVVPPIRDRDDKLATLIAESKTLGQPLAASIAVGDGANDLAMIQAAGLGVAWHGKELLRQAAPARIDYAGLEALLYIQGYRRDEFAAA